MRSAKFVVFGCKAACVESHASVMDKSRAAVDADHAKHDLQRLCKHWSHKIETNLAKSNGRIELPLGRVELAAEQGIRKIVLSGRGSRMNAHILFKEALANTSNQPLLCAISNNRFAVRSYAKLCGNLWAWHTKIQ